VALEGRLGTVLQRRSVEGRCDRISVYVKELVGREVPGNARSTDGFGETLPPFVAGDHGGTDIEVGVFGGKPLRCRAKPLGDEGAEGTLAKVIAGHENPLLALPVMPLVHAVPCGDYNAEVGRVDRRTRAATERSEGPDDEDRAVLAKDRSCGVDNRFGGNGDFAARRSARSRSGSTLQPPRTGWRGGQRPGLPHPLRCPEMAGLLLPDVHKSGCPIRCRLDRSRRGNHEQARQKRCQRSGQKVSWHPVASRPALESRSPGASMLAGRARR
jgi:hypothetical protein